MKGTTDDAMAVGERAWMVDYIASVRWRDAKSGPPHAYTVRAWDQRPGAFEQAVNLIRSRGHVEAFYGHHYVYLTIDGLKYWTMGAPLEETIIINRADASALYGPLLDRSVG